MMFVNILIILLLITRAQQSILQQKLVYQMDISEYCKRRVLPSIFLAKNSVDTASFIMHFTQIELPFSCAISVRTESGNNIIMVMKLIPLKGFKNRCETNTPELLIHNIGETFGGYWGPLWNKVYEKKSVEPKIYTLKTTQKMTSKIDVKAPQLLMATKTTKPALKIEDSEEEDFITVDVPLLNVSGKFVSNGTLNDSEEDEDEMFDLQYNVTPEPGVQYATSVIPIVQFSVKSHHGWRKEGDDEPRFDLDIVEKYTPDHRLTTPHYKSTRRLKFRTFSPRAMTKRRHQYFRRSSTKGKLQIHRFTSHKYTNYNFPTTKALKSLQNVSRSHSWKTIEELINKVNLTASLQKEGDKKLSDKENKILQKISDMKHNSSIYLKPNLYDLKPSSSTTVEINTISISNFNKTQTEYSTQRKAGNKVRSTLSESINQTSTSAGHSPLKKHDSVPSDINENNYLMSLTSSSIVFKATIEDNKSEPTQMPDKSLVDRESWENVVQAAPDMAVLLNRTKDGMKKHSFVTNSGTAQKRLRRKKRNIHAIDISNAAPHNVTTSPVYKAPSSSFGVADVQDFAQLIELQDDDLYGRITLRLLRRFVGPVIYNICDFNTTAKHQHVHLFNASRIVIAINNLTNFAGLTMILTTARSLVAGELGCPVSNIECQVAGARVCIDAMTACDGVPNCGSYDVYDEDQLMCGASDCLQHNVYIAAFTFLAVLLTLLYSVHYWLRRCVPKVADAFFIYTNGIENILLLQPKMRSPHDYGRERPSRHFFPPSMLEPDIDIMAEEVNSNFCKRFMKILCCGLTFRKKKIEKSSNPTEENELTNSGKKTKYSFTALQIENITGMTKVSNQSNSIELMNIKNRKIDPRVSPPTIPVLKSIDSILTLEEPLPEDYKDELGMLKFLKAVRKRSLSSESKAVQLGTLDGLSLMLDKNSEEVEIKNVEYNRHRLGKPGPSHVKLKNNKEQLAEAGPSGIHITESEIDNSISKRLRFNDNTTTIPASIVEVDEDEEDIDEQYRPSHKHNKFLDTVMGKQKFFGSFDEDNEAPLPKEHKRFWGGKAKKQTRSKNTN